MSDPAGRESQPTGGRLMPVVLAVLALLDLRVELQLLLDHFTWTSLAQIPLHHPLALAVLVVTPALMRRR